MERGMESLESAYSVLFTVMLIALAILVMLCLVRAIIGPRVADRIVSVNMTGTMVIVMIAILALMLEEGYLVDICLIYAMISFLAVIVLVKVYMGVYLVGKRTEAAKDSTVRIEGKKQNGVEPGDCKKQSDSEKLESYKKQSSEESEGYKKQSSRDESEDHKKQSSRDESKCYKRHSSSEEPEGYKRQGEDRSECGSVQQSGNVESSGEKESEYVVKQGKARKEDAK